MAESITKTIFGLFFPDGSPSLTTNVNTINPDPPPSPFFPSQNPSTTSLATFTPVTLSSSLTTSLPASSEQHTTSTSESDSGSTESSGLTGTSTGLSTHRQPTTPQSPPSTTSSGTFSTNESVTEHPHKEPAPEAINTKKPSLILGVSLGIVFFFTVLFTSLYICYRRSRRTARHARADQEKAQAYSYPHTIPAIDNNSSDFEGNSTPASRFPFSSSSSSLFPWSGGTVMPRKLASEMTSYSASRGSAARATTTRQHPSQDGFHQASFRNFSMRRLGRGDRGTKFNLQEPPPPEYGT